VCAYIFMAIYSFSSPFREAKFTARAVKCMYAARKESPRNSGLYEQRKAVSTAGFLTKRQTQYSQIRSSYRRFQPVFVPHNDVHGHIKNIMETESTDTQSILSCKGNV
jgi:hypothetical protein